MQGLWQLQLRDTWQIWGIWMSNVQKRNVVDRSLTRHGETWNFQQCVERHDSVCCISECEYSCHLMMVGESWEIGNYPRLQLIHILSSVLAQGRRVIWERDRHTHTCARLHTHETRAYDACWTDLWCRIMNTLHLPLAPFPRARLSSGSIFSLNRVSDAKKPFLTAFPSAAFRQPWQFISHWKWLMYMQITRAWARIQIRETAIRRR